MARSNLGCALTMLGQRTQGMEGVTRIEQAIDAMAVEVERVAEAQRFMTKLLSDRAGERVGIPAASQSRHEG